MHTHTKGRARALLIQLQLLLSTLFHLLWHALDLLIVLFLDTLIKIASCCWLLSFWLLLSMKAESKDDTTAWIHDAFALDTTIQRDELLDTLSLDKTLIQKILCISAAKTGRHLYMRCSYLPCSGTERVSALSKTRPWSTVCHATGDGLM